MKFIVDAQLPPGLAKSLCDAGEEAVAVRDVGLLAASDSQIWDYALAQSAVIVTKDEDFAQRSLCSSQSPVILWLRMGNCTNRALQNALLPILPMIRACIEAGDRVIEVR